MLKCQALDQGSAAGRSSPAVLAAAAAATARRCRLAPPLNCSAGPYRCRATARWAWREQNANLYNRTRGVCSMTINTASGGRVQCSQQGAWCDGAREGGPEGRRWQKRGQDEIVGVPRRLVFGLNLSFGEGRGRAMGRQRRKRPGTRAQAASKPLAALPAQPLLQALFANSTPVLMLVWSRSFILARPCGRQGQLRKGSSGQAGCITRGERLYAESQVHHAAPAARAAAHCPTTAKQAGQPDACGGTDRRWRTSCSYSESGPRGRKDSTPLRPSTTCSDGIRGWEAQGIEHMALRTLSG